MPRFGRFVVMGTVLTILFSLTGYLLVPSVSIYVWIFVGAGLASFLTAIAMGKSTSSNDSR